jgi:hypothetical protein
MGLFRFGGIILAILLARIIPKGIIGVVMVSMLLSYVMIGIKDYTSLFLVSIIPLLIVLFITPECITTHNSRNREYYGSGFNMCKYFNGHDYIVSYIRIVGELLLIGSVILFVKGYSFIKNIVSIIAISCILFEMLFFHPVPLMESEYRSWMLQ